MHRAAKGIFGSYKFNYHTITTTTAPKKIIMTAKNLQGTRRRDYEEQFRRIAVNM
jgi:hypothetical protein